MIHYKKLLFAGLLVICSQNGLFTEASAGQRTLPSFLSLINPQDLEELEQSNEDKNDAVSSFQLAQNDNILLTLSLLRDGAPAVEGFVEFAKVLVDNMVTIKKLPIDSFERFKEEVENDISAEEASRMVTMVTPPNFKDLGGVAEVELEWEKYSHFLSAWNLIQFTSELIYIYTPVVNGRNLGSRDDIFIEKRNGGFEDVMLQVPDDSSTHQMKVLLLKPIVASVFVSIDSAKTHEIQLLKALKMLADRTRGV
jgi:hypothetical protein